jgi:hypothetical protein
MVEIDDWRLNGQEDFAVAGVLLKAACRCTKAIGTTSTA